MSMRYIFINNEHDKYSCEKLAEVRTWGLSNLIVRELATFNQTIQGAPMMIIFVEGMPIELWAASAVLFGDDLRKTKVLIEYPELKLKDRKDN